MPLLGTLDLPFGMFGLVFFFVKSGKWSLAINVALYVLPFDKNLEMKC